MTGTFAKVPVEADILVHQGAGTNLISHELFEFNKKTDGDFEITSLVPPQIYGGVGCNAKISCSNQIQADINLRIRHGSSLLSRNVIWLVSEEKASKAAIIGRPLLKIIACNIKKLLQAVVDANNGLIDTSAIEQELGQLKVDPKIQSLL